MKDETFLCKLSNFDVYSVTRVQKAPKPFVFAVKSTDSLSLFENTSDYLHTFSCKERDGLEWMSKILLARVSFLITHFHKILVNSWLTVICVTPRTSCHPSDSQNHSRIVSSWDS